MKNKLPDAIMEGEKFVCPECKRNFPSKPSYSMHWYHAHTNKFKNKSGKKKYKKKIKEENNRVEIKESNRRILPINFCPGCGLSLVPIAMALNIISKNENQNQD